jgi:diacylglycerol kinase family enzyme
MKQYLAIVNPAAGGGRCGKLAPQALGQLRTGEVAIEVAETPPSWRKKATDGAFVTSSPWEETGQVLRL